jgi:triacylglycerol esterase/lipase EstA (alpha/beta hydrolase family)
MWTAFAFVVVYGAILGAWGWWLALRIAQGESPWPAVVALPLLWLAVPFVVTSLSFVIAHWFRSQRPRHVALGPATWVRMFWREFGTIAGNTPRQVFYRVLVPDPPPAPAERPVLLLHGVLCNAGVWRYVCTRLAAAGIGPVYALSYGPPLGSIDDFADQMRDKVDAILAATGAAGVVVVAHSMGGLVARAYLRKHGGSKLRRLITVGTPHEGSVHARVAPGVSLSQLRPGNPWLGALGTPQGDSLPPIVSLWSWHDTMVAPQTSSRIAFGENVELAGVGHNALLTDPKVADRLIEEIGKA